MAHADVIVVVGGARAPALECRLAHPIGENEFFPLFEPLAPVRCGARAYDRSWVRDEGVRRHHNYCGIACMASGSKLEGLSVEHYAWK